MSKLEGVGVQVPEVLLDLLETNEVSVAEMLSAALQRMDDFKVAQHGNPAGREFALAITHAEDARSRFNAGIYMMNGTYSPSDAQRQVLPPAETEAT